MKGLIITANKMKIANQSELVQEQLRRLLFIPLNELIGKLQYGSRMKELLNNLKDNSLTSNVINEIEYLVQVNMPMIYINSIEVEFENGYIYTMVTTIKYTLISDNTDDEATIINSIATE
jgi:phage baseplate assembly protein W